ncbi:MAG: aminomethyl transferase family protein [SAR202 cluster bacterium]|jgi:folate-binding protein YgfZ|nr:hypothetical protein [Chloroflexota bacterium]MDP6422886.1 glycine cleavage T C-terminal barrel domain-containing protein [SAR202 cluster bacterium]HAL46956.1 hypothetical protein [Dehalococcoidia bacterium]MDP6665464.1 glycine cleavage T C-terminal barrel domain-containing protein [SAR202 cluster bacterium]MDP6798258.1 glycine cleavage T C-terminal barrel domain-containing protein [SAR202 cluster bacterium]|tara:strand:+ start:2434 stop:3426 length:993 start_codon:yes stop_codon:yes gene_type:complete
MASPKAVPISRDVDDVLSTQFRVLTEQTALVDRSAVGRLKITGDDAIDLLDRLSTNDLRGLTVGLGAGTVLTTNKGRVIDLLTVLHRGDHLLVLTGRGNQHKVAEWIDFYTFTEDVEVQDITEETATISVVGPKSASAVDAALAMDCGNWDLFNNGVCQTLDGVTVVRTDSLGVSAYDIVTGRTTEAEVRERFAAIGVSTVDPAAAELLRIENLIPTFGAELTEEYNPLEAGLLEHVSFNKGCYIGQEVVARLNAYDKVQRRLVSLTWDSDATIPVGASLASSERSVGVVTSSFNEDGSDRRIALALVRKSHSEPGTTLVADDQVDVVIT